MRQVQAGKLLCPHRCSEQEALCVRAVEIEQGVALLLRLGPSVTTAIPNALPIPMTARQIAHNLTLWES